MKLNSEKHKIIQMNKNILKYTNPTTECKLSFVIQERDLTATMDTSLKTSAWYNVKIYWGVGVGGR